MAWSIATGTLFEDFETLGDWSQGSEGTATLNTTLKKTGASSLKLQTDGAGASSSFQVTKSISADFSRVGTVALWIYVENDTTTASLRVRITSDSSFAKYFDASFTSSIHEGWNYVLIGKDQWTNTGSENWTNTMTRLRFVVGGTATDTVGTVYLDSMYTSVYSRPKCIIYFDDQPSTTYTLAYPYMKQYDFKGVIPVISSTVGANGKCSLAELTEMHSYGWDMVNHTINHQALATLSRSEMDSEISGCTAYLRFNGFTRRNEHLMLAYPLSSQNQTTWASADAQGVLLSRTQGDRTQANISDDLHAIPGYSNDSGTTAASIKVKIDKAISDGGTAHLYFHILRTPEDIATTLDPAIFYEVIDYLARKREQIDVITLSEWYQGLTRTRKSV